MTSSLCPFMQYKCLFYEISALPHKPALFTLKCAHFISLLWLFLPLRLVRPFPLQIYRCIKLLCLFQILLLNWSFTSALLHRKCPSVIEYFAFSCKCAFLLHYFCFVSLFTCYCALTFHLHHFMQYKCAFFYRKILHLCLFYLLVHTDLFLFIFWRNINVLFLWNDIFPISRLRPFSSQFCPFISISAFFKLLPPLDISFVCFDAI